MRRNLNIDLVFPIKDEVSAWLMCLKAELLCDVGIIDTDEMSSVLGRVAAVLDQADQVDESQLWVCAVEGRRFPVGVSPTRQDEGEPTTMTVKAGRRAWRL
jgi:hypothetical protein